MLSEMLLAQFLFDFRTMTGVAKFTVEEIVRKLVTKVTLDTDDIFDFSNHYPPQRGEASREQR